MFTELSNKEYNRLKSWYTKTFNNGLSIFRQQKELLYLARVQGSLNSLACLIQAKNISFLQRIRLHYSIKEVLAYEEIWYDQWFAPKYSIEQMQIDIEVYSKIFSRFHRKGADNVSECLVDDLVKLREQVSEAKSSLKNFKGWSAWICASVAKFALDVLNFNFIKSAMETISSTYQQSKHKIVKTFSHYCKSTWVVLAGSFLLLGRDYSLARKYNKSLKSFGLQKICHGILSQTICHETKINFYRNSADNYYIRNAIKIGALTIDVLLNLCFAAENLKVDVPLVLYFVMHRIFAEIGSHLTYWLSYGSFAEPLKVQEKNFLLQKSFIKFIGSWGAQECLASSMGYFSLFKFTPNKKSREAALKSAKETLGFCDMSDRAPTKLQLEKRYYSLSKLTHPDRRQKTCAGKDNWWCSDGMFEKTTGAYEFLKGYCKEYGEGQGVYQCLPNITD